MLSRDAARFQVERKIGEGAFGEVLLGRDTRTLRKVAIKTLSTSEDSVPRAVIREIRALREASGHPNIVSLISTVVAPPGVWLVFEHMATDLKRVMVSLCGSRMPTRQVKKVVESILRALDYIHSLGIVHRDVKPGNVLISDGGTRIALADFGLARSIDTKSPPCNLTNAVATRWYKAPELLLGSRSYDAGIDIWAAGCIFGELLRSAPLFAGQNEIDQLCCIVRVMGQPDETRWPGVSKLPDFGKISFTGAPASSQLRQAAGGPFDCDPGALDLLEKLIVLSPEARVPASTALTDEYFFTEPLPSAVITLPQAAVTETKPTIAESIAKLLE